jgi:DNA polymerase-2
MKAFVVYPTYRVVPDPETGKEKSLVYLYGRLENKESFLAICPFKPYFWIKKKDEKIVSSLQSPFAFEIEHKAFHDFKGEEVVKIVLQSPKHVPDTRRTFEDNKVQCYEADIRFAYRYMMDAAILGSCDIEGKYVKGEFVDRVYEEPTITPASWFPQLKVLSIDIETDAQAKSIWAVSMVTDSYEHVFLKHDKTFKHATSYNDEKELLIAFKNKVRELDPDVIIGWNLIDFDMNVLHNLFKKHNIDFHLGRGDVGTTLKIFSDFFRESTVDCLGRQVLDGIALLKNAYIKLEDYKLSTASHVFLNEKKLIGDENKWQEIDKAYREHTQHLVDYNLKDSQLALGVVQKTGALDLAIQRSLLTGMPLERVRASIASLDSLYIREANKRKLVSPSGGLAEKDEQTKGGFVMASKPGIYEDILDHDFKSLYPSIMRTFNIDPAAYVGQDSREKNIVKTVNGACFRNEDGILPVLIQRLWEERDKAKKAKNARASQAIKIIMNSFYGVLANPTCRYFNPHIANAITHTGQHLIKLSAEKVRDMGYDVIYGDTDSIFTDPHAKDEKEAEEIGRRIEAGINTFYGKYIAEQHNRTSYMELEFEKVFIKFLMPTIRSGTVGAKKRYAGIIRKEGKEKLEFTGLEFVRSDWTELAKKFQQELLDKIFHEKEVATFIKEYIIDLRKGKYDELLVYKKSIRKELIEYTKTTPPHVKAARLLEKAGKKIDGTVIRYLMTENGPEPLELRKGKIDYEHYIDKQIRPIADSILSFYNMTFDDILKNSKQKTLFGY